MGPRYDRLRSARAYRCLEYVLSIISIAVFDSGVWASTHEDQRGEWAGVWWCEMLQVVTSQERFLKELIAEKGFG